MIKVFGESRPVCISKVELALERGLVWCDNCSQLNADGSVLGSWNRLSYKLTTGGGKQPAAEN